MQAEDQKLEVRMSNLITRHLDLYFPDSENNYRYLTSNVWVLNPFAVDGTDHSEALFELRIN